MTRHRTALLVFCLIFPAAFSAPALLAAGNDEVELHFDGRPKVGEPYQLYVNSKQVRT